MASVDQIQNIVSPIVESRGAFVVEINIRGTQNGKVVEIFVDTDRGITTGECADLSNEISPTLDRASLFAHRYHLVVSSPGVERPLKFARQYPRNVGRAMIISYRDDGIEGKIQGTLIEATPSELSLRTEKGELKKIPVDQVLEARVKAAW